MEPNYVRRRAGLLEDFRHDTRIGLRSLARQAGFGLVSVGTLALGIGIFTTFFTLVNGVLLKPLPYMDLGQLKRSFDPANARTATTILA